MYIIINDIIGEKRIDLSYPIHPTAKRGKEIAVVSMHSNNAQYWLQGPIEVLSRTGKKIVLNKAVYTDKELNAITGQELKSRKGDRDDVLRTSKLVNGMKIVISLNELDNSDNLENGRPSNTLFTYYVTSPEYYTRFEPRTAQYKARKNDTITFLTLKITDQAGNIIPGDFRSWESPQTLPALFIGSFEHVERFGNLKFPGIRIKDIQSTVLSSSEGITAIHLASK